MLVTFPLSWGLGVLLSFVLSKTGFSRYKFTWSNRRNDNFIEKRLDRALTNDDWLDLYPSFVVKNIIWDSSDHSLISCKEIIRDGSEVPWDEKPFKFEAKWLHVGDFKEVMVNAWHEA